MDKQWPDAGGTIRLVSLNLWGGALYKPLSSFLKQSSKGVDIFCFQEVLYDKNRNAKGPWKGAVPNLYDKIKDILPGSSSIITEPYTSYGERMAIFTNDRIKVTISGDIGLCKRETMEVEGREYQVESKLQWISFEHDGRKFTIGNVHGFWVKGSMDDSPERILQSKKIIKFFNGRNSAKILCGDFNLSPGIKSVAMIEKDFRNLTKEYKVKSTRSKHYKPKTDMGRITDYTFISPEVKLVDFRVLGKEVSDHLPLLLEFG